jgi:predicted dehydrogenase
MSSDALVQIDVVEQRILPARAASRFFEAKYSRPIRKATYFARTEGIAATVRKARSKLVEKQLEKAQEIVIARAEHPSLVGFTRRLGSALEFHPALVFATRVDATLEDLVLDAEAITLLESYLPVPACPLAEQIAALLLRQNRSLRPLNSAERLKLTCSPVEKLTLPIRSRPNPVFLIGFGGYVREQVLPHFADDVVAALDHKSGLISSHLKMPFPIVRSFDQLLEAIARANAPLVIVASYHSDHAAQALRVLETNRNARVFIEKPVAVELADAERLRDLRTTGAWIDVGFNRRFAPFFRRLARNRPEGPLIFDALIKELKIPSCHWYEWPNQGTRITGNVCHWIDLACALIRSPPQELTVLTSGGSVSLSIMFSDGSLATIGATDHGDDLRGVREYISVRTFQETYVIDDFLGFKREHDGRVTRRLAAIRDKGHAAMYSDLNERWKAGAAPVYPADDIARVARITWQASQMIRSGQRHHRF